jgi:hypothetical protein
MYFVSVPNVQMLKDVHATFRLHLKQLPSEIEQKIWKMYFSTTVLPNCVTRARQIVAFRIFTYICSKPSRELVHLMRTSEWQFAWRTCARHLGPCFDSDAALAMLRSGSLLRSDLVTQHFGAWTLRKPAPSSSTQCELLSL